MLDSWFDEYVNIIAESRELDREKVLGIIDQALLDADEAVHRGLVDHQAYLTEYRDRVLRRERMKKYKDYETDWSQINSLQDILNMMSREWQKEKERREAVGPKIAVLNARGVIIDVSLGPAFATLMISSVVSSPSAYSSLASALQCRHFRLQRAVSSQKTRRRSFSTFYPSASHPAASRAQCTFAPRPIALASSSSR